MNKSCLKAAVFALAALTVFCAWAKSGEPLCLTALEDGVSVKLVIANRDPAPQFSYRLGSGVWQGYSRESVISLKSGEKAYFRATGYTDQVITTVIYGEETYFVISGAVAASGDATTLINAGGTDSVPYRGLCGLFTGCAGLTEPPELPATKLGEECYSYMFSGCGSLVHAPKLPATVIADGCYMGMFQNCSKLVEAPALPATVMKDSCYKEMFRGCTSITSAPVLKSTELADKCYLGMFWDCTGLVTAPALPATVMKTRCYGLMFSGCGRLAAAPKLPATELEYMCYEDMFHDCVSLASAPELPARNMKQECYDKMFWGCTGITEPPALPAKELAHSCYCNMFYGCTGLSTAPALPATTLAESCYWGMFAGTAITTGPVLPAKKMEANCYSGMFEDCAMLLKAPELPATELAERCYQCMFMNCTALRSAPVLPAQKLARQCYRSMFNGCSSLSEVTLAAKEDMVDGLLYWLDDVAEQGVLRCPADLYNPGLPPGWTRADYTPDPIKPDPVKPDPVDPVDLPDVTKKPQTYNGYIADGTTIVGTIQVKAAKAKTDKKSKATVSALTISVQPATSTKKISLKGNYDLDLGGPQSFKDTKGNAITLELFSRDMEGVFNGAAVVGVVAGGDAAAYAGSYNMIANEGSFSVTVDRKGKVSVKGTSAAGKVVTVTAQLIIGDGEAIAPVIAPKAGLSFVLWFESGKITVSGLTDAYIGTAGTLSAGAAFFFDALGLSSALADALGGDDHAYDDDLATFLPNGIVVRQSGTKWIVAPDAKGKAAKAGKVVLNKAKTGIDRTKLGVNPSGLKLTFTAKTGSFKGSFKAYTLVKGKLKATTVNVSGVVIDGIAIGIATVKNPAVTFPVWIE